MGALRRHLLVAAIAAATALAAPAAAHAAPYIHPHRGGSVADGTPRYGEATMPAFRNAARKGFVLELDAKLTRDGVAVVFHDATLDRATDCTGRIDHKTFAELRACRVDILGTTGSFVQLAPGEGEPVPTLDRVLRLANRHDAEANIEIKNVPTDPDFDPTDGFANSVMDVIAASDIPRADLIIQSFWPRNLAVAEDRLPEAERSLLSLSATNDGAPSFADANGIEWVSPQWPVGAGFVAQAHALGLRVVPYTLDSEAAIAAAAELGVDAIITNDPTLARRVVADVVGPPPPIPPPPSRSACRATKASTHLPAIVARAPAPGAPRVFAMQYKQDLANVATYDAFRTKIECLIRQYARKRLAPRRPDIVAFNEDVGLMTIATGSRGEAARQILGDPESAPSCEPQGAPCGALAGLEAITTAYGSQVGAYQARYPGTGALESGFLAPTDTFARGWMQVFSDMARRYGVYILGSNTQAPFRESRDPSEIAAFADPDLPAPGSVYVATEGNVYNEVFMWGPRDARREGPRPLRNVVAQNQKVPLTSLETQLEVSSGPATGPDGIENVRPYELPGTEARISFATSLPAFVFGHEIGEPPPGVDPCSDTALYYMRCLDQLGTNLVIQDEANPGRWAVTQVPNPVAGASGGWQPLEWMSSSWRHVADRSVGFDYNVTPFMVGNLADIVFDGQSSITQRGRAVGRGCRYIGTGRFRPDPPESDPPSYRRYSGRKRQFVALAPWVSRGGGRRAMRDVATRLAPGSGDPIENDYVETALVADLPFPVDRTRRACARR